MTWLPLERLSRPVGFYLPLVEAQTSVARMWAESVSEKYAVGFDKRLERSKPRPTSRWYGIKSAYVPPPRKPTVTPSPSAKGKAAVSSPKKGGVSRALRSVVSALKQPSPHRPAQPVQVMSGGQKPEYDK